jgi:hypothetical protein
MEDMTFNVSHRFRLDGLDTACCRSDDFTFLAFCEDRPTGLEFCMHYWNIYTTLRRPLQGAELDQNPDSRWRR